MKDKSGIYQIFNSANGKRYIGSASRLIARWKEHARRLARGAHENSKLQNAWNKYGEASFNFSVVEFVEDRSSLVSCEQKWMDHFNCIKSGYNISPTAGSCIGVKHTDRARANMSDAHKGKKQDADLIASRTAWKRGVPHTPEHCAAISVANKNPSAETRAKMALVARARVYSPERKARMAAAQLGKKRGPHSDLHKARISASLKGKDNGRTGTKHSEETKSRMRAAWDHRRMVALNKEAQIRGQ